MESEWIILKALPDSVMVAVAGSEQSARYLREGSTAAEKTLERARDALYDALELLNSCLSKRCSEGDYKRVSDAAYWVGVELLEPGDS